jgi:hypothetical protein
MLAPGDPEFSAWFNQFRHSCFRLETLQSYGSSGEDDSLATFLAGQDPQPHPGKREWMKLVSTAARDCRVMQRVHVVTEPVTDYVQFEVAWSYAYSVSAGEDVRIVPLSAADPWPAGVPQRDFWLFDDAELFTMCYATEGTWLGSEHTTDPAAVQAAHRARDTALEHSIPWADYVGDRPELQHRVPGALWRD